MRLEPIDEPRSLLLRIAFAVSRRQFGKVIQPLRTIYARAPNIARTAYGLGRAADTKLSLSDELRLLIQAQTSALNGCGFCLDLKRAMALQEGLGLEKFNALPTRLEQGSHAAFSEGENAALEYCAEITRSKKVSDATFERLRAHFSEQEIVELTFANAVENFYNSMGVPLGLESDGLCALAGHA